jgi:hypothetical protein
MRRAISQRILAIGLLMSRLVFADVIHMPEAQSAAQPVGDATMMAGMPCHGGRGAADTRVPHQGTSHQAPPGSGTCCNASQCLCFTTPALATRFTLPAASHLTLTTMATPSVQRATERETVFFRPPI